MMATAEQNLQRRQRLFAAGLCTHCGKLPRGVLSLCAVCRAKQRQVRLQKILRRTRNQSNQE